MRSATVCTLVVGLWLGAGCPHDHPAGMTDGGVVDAMDGGVADAVDAAPDVPDVIGPPSLYQGRCASPRSGTDPATGMPYRDVQGTVLDEQLWVRSWIDDLYLWFREVPRLDPRGFMTAVAYFNALKTPAVTPSGRPRDVFHFTLPTSDWLAQSTGPLVSYGVTWVLVQPSPPRRLVAGSVDPGSVAAAAGLDRGAEVLTIDGVDVVLGTDVDTLNKVLNPSAADETHTFVVVDQGASTSRTVVLTSTAGISAVPIARVLPAPADKVGYLLFNVASDAAEMELVTAITQLRAAGISDLVVDLRYNAGGSLAIFAELAYMIAGPSRTRGRVFERPVYNDKHASLDPVTQQPIVPTPFYERALGFSVPSGTPLPTLDLPRVFILTGPVTCASSEALLNGLAGIDVDVIQVGATTCGRPYGWLPTDNCGTTYFAIAFQGVNDKSLGDYAGGFTPGAALPGCAIGDDLAHALGDPAEARLAGALAHAATGSCSPPARSPEGGGPAALPLLERRTVMFRQ